MYGGCFEGGDGEVANLNLMSRSICICVSECRQHFVGLSACGARKTNSENPSVNNQCASW